MEKKGGNVPANLRRGLVFCAGFFAAREARTPTTANTAAATTILVPTSDCTAAFSTAFSATPKSVPQPGGRKPAVEKNSASAPLPAPSRKFVPEPLVRSQRHPKLHPKLYPKLRPKLRPKLHTERFSCAQRPRWSSRRGSRCGSRLCRRLCRRFRRRRR